MVKKEDIPGLNQLIKSLEDAFIGLEESYGKKDFVRFNDSKKFMIDIQKKIAEAIK